MNEHMARLYITPADYGVSGAGRIVLLDEHSNPIETVEFSNSNKLMQIDVSSMPSAAKYKLQIRLDGKWRMHGNVRPISNSSAEAAALQAAELASAPVDDKLIKCDAALRYLALGFDFRADSFSDVVEMLVRTMRREQKRRAALVGAASKNPVDSLRSALLSSVRTAIERSGAKSVRIGITGGMDSRLLYAAVREVLPDEKIFTFTLGYRGQYDFEFARKYGKNLLPNNHLIETKEIVWDVSEEVCARNSIGKPGAYSSKRHMYRIVEELGAPRHNVHGFMGDPLIGGTKPSNDIPVASWDDACERFIKKNNRWNMQCLFSRETILSLLPDETAQRVPGLDAYDMLDFGLRQYQRILGDTLKSPFLIAPYTDERWLSAMISIPKLLEREQAYYSLLRSWAPDVFPELIEFDIKNRNDHKKFRAALTENADREIRASGLTNNDGSLYRPQIRSDSGKSLDGRQFCERAEYSNNPSFRQFINEAFNGLRARELMPDKFLEDTWQDFIFGKKPPRNEFEAL